MFFFPTHATQFAQISFMHKLIACVLMYNLIKEHISVNEKNYLSSNC